MYLFLRIPKMKFSWQINLFLQLTNSDEKHSPNLRTAARKICRGGKRNPLIGGKLHNGAFQGIFHGG